MDISKAHSLIFQFLSEHDSYSTNESYKLLDWKSLEDSGEELDDKECKLAVELAFENLVENDVVKKIERGAGKNKETIYIATNSLKNQPISIDLSRESASQIATVVNNFLPLISLEEIPPVRPQDLSENELLLLLEVIGVLGGQTQKYLEKEQKEIDELNKKKNNNKNKDNPPEI